MRARSDGIAWLTFLCVLASDWESRTGDSIKSKESIDKSPSISPPVMIASSWVGSGTAVGAAASVVVVPDRGRLFGDSGGE